ncbi:helix-turn-helix domain-containing protein [Dactylosporangium sp. NPDC051484]|uniref:helix-turn-helix domain-containing protein n=1 Tax=Dactylosporangium sp. NPDC051484 TaxID=3154942 RepID=UPI00344DECC8
MLPVVQREGTAMPRQHDELAGLLTELKERSGRSYAWIGLKVNASKSAVHRYCAGHAVPHDFGMIERIARACDADQADLDQLYKLWAAAVRDEPPVVEPATGTAMADDPAAHAADAVPPTAPAPVVATMPRNASPRPGRTLGGRHHRTYVLIFAAVVLLTATAIVVLNRTPQGRPSAATQSATPQWISGPTWNLPPQPVPKPFFGVTINSSTGDMPGFTVGAVRLWDSETRWAQIQPTRGTFDWSVLDRLVSGAEHAGLPVLFVFGGTPGWAAPNGRRSVYPEDARSTPPDNLPDWEAFVRAVTDRYRDRIQAYELWVLATDQRMYSGSVETLVDMTRRASAIVRAADPKATIVCPGMGDLWNPEGQQMLQRFAGLGGYDYCDVAGVKLHQRSADDPPETMLELTTLIDHVFHEAGAHPPLWNTGTTYTIPLQGPLDRTKARNYAVRFFLVGLLTRNTNLQRMYFYNWGGTKIPIVLQADGGEPTSAGRAVEQFQAWLSGAEIRSCGHGPAVDLPVNAWECRFTVMTLEGTRRAVVRWTHTGTAAMRVEQDATVLRRLDGSTVAVTPGSDLVLSEEPVLIQFGS